MSDNNKDELLEYCKSICEHCKCYEKYNKPYCFCGAIKKETNEPTH